MSLISHLLKQSISYSNPDSLDVHAKPSFNSPVTVKARVERTRKNIIDKEHELVPIDLIVFVVNADIKIGAKLTYDSQSYRVLVVDDIVGGNGNLDHRELKCQLWSYGS